MFGNFVPESAFFLFLLTHFLNLLALLPEFLISKAK